MAFHSSLRLSTEDTEWRFGTEGMVERRAGTHPAAWQVVRNNRSEVSGAGLRTILLSGGGGGAGGGDSCCLGGAGSTGSVARFGKAICASGLSGL